MRAALRFGLVVLGLLAASNACSSSNASNGGAFGGASAAGGAKSAAGGAPVNVAGSTTVLGFGGATGAASGGSAGCANMASCRVGCGNGIVEVRLGEVCDDGNSQPGDGCSADCTATETNFTCPEPGKPCVNLVRCGDGKVLGTETCDDGNTESGDGCSSGCALEPNWTCPAPGVPCAPQCGDGVVAGNEQCDAPNVGRGCSAACRVEPGYVCDAPASGGAAMPAQCRLTVCGDRNRQGSEACDDGNAIDGDGCSALCTLEPSCGSGGCTSKCGDHLRLGDESCDDGNTVDGDGCSHDCKPEAGYTCSDSTQNPPGKLNLAVTYRDFRAFPVAPATRHPDFEADLKGEDRTVSLVKAALGSDGKPVMDGRCSAEDTASFTNATLCPFGQMLTTRANFEQWYRDVPGVNLAIQSSLLLPRLANGSYVFDSAPGGFYPIDDTGFTVAPKSENTAQADAVVNDGLYHDYGFTTEIHYFFQYKGGETLAFSGDDDLWIFINQKLALDVGGLHKRTELSLALDSASATLGLTRGGLYEIALFHAERHSAGSNFKLTLTGFAPAASVCQPTCGDGVRVAPEQCDLGNDKNTGEYGGCQADCRLAAFCGDKTVQREHESCDDGANVTTYSLKGSAGCAPGCVPSGYCGDAKLDSLFDEQCDLGKDKNDGAYGACTSDCRLGPRCGDGVVQKEFNEKCDDGNRVSGDGCSYDCQPDIR